MSKIFSQSPDMKKEYCCSVVRIGEIKPIEGKDLIGQTLVNGFPVVVRKDQVHEGDVLFYASVESQLEAEFCRANNLFEDKTMNSDPEKKGYFNKYGRVRIVKLGGVPSMGYLFSAEEMKTYIGIGSDKTDFDMEKLIGTEFDTVDGYLFCKAFVPPTKDNNHVGGGKGVKRNKKLKQFDRMIPGEFSFHYDTDQFEKNVHRFNPEDKVAISVKLHGTSAIIGNIKVREPKFNTGVFGTLYTKYFEYLPKFLQFTNEKYDYIYSSRTVIKNKNINPAVTGGYYGSDVWAKFYDLFKKYDVIGQGMTIYGEIIGFTDNGTAIQKMGNAFDYGCEPKESKLMIYRIVTELEDGTKCEWEVPEIQAWTDNVKYYFPDLAPYIHTIDVLYVGTLKNLYPDLDTENHWHENLLERMKNDKEHFGMEMNEPLCKNKLPREGIVIRRMNDPIKEAFKLKCMKFRFKEAESVDKGEVDVEMEQAY